MKTVWKNENELPAIETNHPHILLPDGRWAPITQPVLSVWEGDIWCDPLEFIQNPYYEQLYARIHNSIVDVGYCGPSGEARYAFIHLNFHECAKGDLFDENSIFIDRERTWSRPEDEVTFCDYFGVAPRRTMNRIKERAKTPRKRLLQDRLIGRMCRFSIALKEFLARAGYPEFCERSVPQGFLNLQVEQQR